jgi:hypothetical protein
MGKEASVYEKFYLFCHICSPVNRKEWKPWESVFFKCRSPRRYSIARKMPAAMAEPMTPPTLGPMANISRKLDALSFCPTVWHTRADMGTAETPAAPMSGLTLPAGGLAHDFAHEHARRRSNGKGHQPENDDLNRFNGQKVGRAAFGPHRKPQENDNDIVELVLRGLAQPIGYAAFPEQVAQHEHAQKGQGGGQEKAGNEDHDDGEKDSFPFGSSPGVLP